MELESRRQIAAERDQLREELAREKSAWAIERKMANRHSAGELSAAMELADANATIAGLRDALEEIAVEPDCGCGPICQCRKPQTGAFELEEKKELAKLALARTPAQHRSVIEEAVLRLVIDSFPNIEGGELHERSFTAWVLSEIDRIEREAQDGPKDREN